ncbi:MAG: caspase family protein [Ardenticatenales bacterium]|nr:caspase family protein [Ardenticatenales bacterium]
MSKNAKRGWKPESTWLFVVGTLEWKNSDMFSPFPQEQRRDAALVDFFKESGVPQGQIIYLQDKHATSERINKEMRKHLPQAAEGDMLFFYYCGHGYRSDDSAAFFASYDSGDEGISEWAMDSVPKMIEAHFPGSHALLAVDCCYSGMLASAIKERNGSISYACLTSSLASEASTGNWTFTEGLLAGLRGNCHIDSESDGTITLEELAQQIKDDMAFAEEQRTSFAVTGTFDPKIILATAKAKSDPRVGQRVEVEDEGDWYKARIIDARNGKFKVHYYGWEESDQDWVGPERIRDFQPRQFPVGTQVEVKWKQKWFQAEVLQSRGGVHLIHYLDYSDEWDEWVASNRIRLPES